MTKAKTEDGGKSHDKPCTKCGTPRSVLVRCQIDETGKWHFVCPGKCWKEVSGGIEDAKGFEEEHGSYRYGGMWKNKHADGPISAKKPKRVKEKQKRLLEDRQRREQHGENETQQQDSSQESSGDGEVHEDHDQRLQNG